MVSLLFGCFHGSVEQRLMFYTLLSVCPVLQYKADIINTA